MALTPSRMLPLGTKAPDFRLQDSCSQKFFSLSDVRGAKGTLILFICNHCPYVKHIITGISELARDLSGTGIGVVAINANDVQAYPEDSPLHMKEFSAQYGLNFPYLFDETQQVAKAYQAACTPDFFLFDQSDACVYRGRFDGATPGNQEPVTGADLRKAIHVLLSGGSQKAQDQKPSLGCNIKWKKT